MSIFNKTLIFLMVISFSFINSTCSKKRNGIFAIKIEKVWLNETLLEKSVVIDQLKIYRFDSENVKPVMEKTMSVGEEREFQSTLQIITSKDIRVKISTSNDNEMMIYPDTDQKGSGSDKGEMWVINKGKTDFNVLNKKLNFFSVITDTWESVVKGTSFSVAYVPNKKITYNVTKGKIQIKRSGIAFIEDEGLEIQGFKEKYDNSEKSSIENLKSYIKSSSGQMEIELNSKKEYLYNFKSFVKAEEDFSREYSKADNDLKEKKVEVEEYLEKLLNLAILYSVKIEKKEQAIELCKNGIQLLEKEKLSEKNKLKWQTIFHEYIAESHFYAGEYSEAIKFYKLSLDLLLKLYGAKSHPTLIESYKKLAGTYLKILEYQSALDALNQALKIKMNLDITDTDEEIQEIYHYIIVAKIGLQDFEDGLKIGNKYLKVLTDVLSEPRLILASLYNDIGQLYIYQNEFASAIELFEKSLEISSAISGMDSLLQKVKSYNGIGQAQFGQHNYKSAETYHLKALDALENTKSEIGEKEKMKSLNYLGLSLIGLKKYDEANQKLNSSLKIATKLFKGKTKSEIPKIYNNLGLSYQGLQNFEKALIQHTKALEIASTNYEGKMNIDMVVSHNYLGYVSANLKKSDDAINHLKKSAEIGEKLFGKKFNQEMIFNNIYHGFALSAQKKYKNALEYYEKALEYHKNIFKEIFSPEKAMVYTLIGEVYYRMADYNQANENFKKSLSIYLAGPEAIKTKKKDLKKANSKNKSKTKLKKNKKKSSNRKIDSYWILEISNCYQNIGKSLVGKEKYKDAIASYENSLEIRKKIFGDDPHPVIANTYLHIGFAYRGLGKFEKAKESFEKALEKMPGNKPSQELAEIYRNLGNGWKDLEDYDRALENYFKAEKEYKKVFSEEPYENQKNLYLEISLCYAAKDQSKNEKKYKNKSIDAETRWNNSSQK